jgi:hypothetical protein
VRLVTVCRVYHVVLAPAKDVAVALVPWLRRVDSVTPLGGGWNTSTWIVATGDDLAIFAVLARPAGPHVAWWFARGGTCGLKRKR